jgi:hypothetical protein
MSTKEGSARKLIWNEKLRMNGCSRCEWVFNLSGPQSGNSLQEMARKFEEEVYTEFASHACADYATVGKL